MFVCLFVVGVIVIISSYLSIYRLEIVLHALYSSSCNKEPLLLAHSFPYRHDLTYQVIKPAGATPAPAPAPAPAGSTRNDSLLQLVSKIKSMVEPNAASQPKLKQLQQTLASLIKVP